MLKATVVQAVATARSALGDLLMEAQLVKREPAVYVPGTTPEYPESEAGVMIYMSRYFEREVDGDRIRASDYRSLVFPVDAGSTILPGAVPDLNDVLRVGEQAYRVMRANNVMAGDAVVLSEVQMRLS